MLKAVLIPTLLLLLAACGQGEMKDFHLTLIGEMEEFPELDTWTPVAEGSVGEDTALAEQALKVHYADLMDIVRPKSVVAHSRWAKEMMVKYDRVPELADLKLTPVAESEDQSLLLLSGVWEELPKQEPIVSRRLMIYPIYDRTRKKVSHVTVTIRGEKTE